MVSLGRSQVGKQVERAGHENAPSRRRRAAPRERGGRVGDGLDVSKDGRAPRSELRGRQRAGVRRARWRRASARRRASALEHRVGVLVGEDRGDDDVVAGLGSRASSQSTAPAVVRAVPDLVGSRELEPAGERAPRPRAVDAAGPRNASAAATRAAESTDARRAPGRERRRTRSPGARRSRRARRPRASRPRSPRASRRARPCGRARRSSGRRPGASSTFVASCRPPSPASTTATSTPRAANSAKRGRGQHLELRRADRLRRATRASARSKSASSPSTWIRSCQPRTCGEMYAPTAARRASERRGARASSTCRSCRRRGSPGTRAAARRAAASSARIRSEPEARPSGHGATATRAQSVAERVELAPVALELLALGLDHLGPARSATKRSFASILSAARDLLAQPLALGLDVAVRLSRAPA